VHFDEDELWEETDSCCGFYGTDIIENGMIYDLMTNTLQFFASQKA
jgi:hypothetical protein